MGPTPLRPSRRPAKVERASLPSDVMAPTPVTTTRRPLMAEPPGQCAAPAPGERAPGERSAEGLLQVPLDVLDGVPHRLDLLRVLVGDVEVELVLELHDELHGVEGIGAEVVDERRLVRHLLPARPH